MRDLPNLFIFFAIMKRVHLIEGLTLTSPHSFHVATSCVTLQLFFRVRRAVDIFSYILSLTQYVHHPMYSVSFCSSLLELTLFTPLRTSHLSLCFFHSLGILFSKEHPATILCMAKDFDSLRRMRHGPHSA